MKAFLTLYLLASAGALFTFYNVPAQMPMKINVVAPTPESLTEEMNNEQKQMELAKAKHIAAHIFHANGCDNEFAGLVAKYSLDRKLPVRVVSALIVVESTCRAGVRSTEGAIGLMQIVPKVWHVKEAQLRDPEFNIRKGTEILAGYVQAHGLRAGLRHYNGMGVGCSTCDAGYQDRVLLVAGYRR